MVFIKIGWSCKNGRFKIKTGKTGEKLKDYLTNRIKSVIVRCNYGKVYGLEERLEI